MIDVILVTNENFPLIFRCFEMIAHDNGAGAGHTNYAIPMVWEPILPSIQEALNKLNNKELTDLCIGEESDRNKLLNRRPELSRADELFQEVFELI